MKKWILLFFAVLILALLSVYVWIPANLRVAQSKQFSVNSKGFKRVMDNGADWQAWWPGEATNGAKNFTYKATTFTIAAQRFSSVSINVAIDGDLFQTELFFLPTRPDSVLLNWTSSSASPTNPLRRWHHYNHAVTLKAQMQIVLDSLTAYYSNEEHIYGMVVNKDFVQDSILISTSAQLKSYPSVAAIQTLIDKLKSYAAANAATITGLPMLNVFTSDSVEYLTKVALPVDKKLPNSTDVQYKWMLGGGRILSGEVTGGPHRINKGFQQLQFYIEDHRHTAPAISFQSLITDRSKEPDTAKWRTKLYWPVM